MISAKSLLLACAAPLAIAAAQAQTPTVAWQQPLVVAQAPADKSTIEEQRKKRQERREQRQQAQPPAAKPVPPPAAQTKPDAPQRPAQARPERPQRPAQARPEQPARGDAPQRPAQTAPATPQPPAAQTRPDRPERPAATDRRPGAPDAQPSATQTRPAAPAADAQKDAAPAAPTRVRDASEFLRRDGSAPRRGLEEVRKERRETREGDRVVIREGTRTIIRQDNRVIIQHNESSRFAVGARTIRTEQRGNETVTVVERPGGVRIVTVTDRNGNLIRRVRRDPNGRDVVLIDNRFAGARVGFFINIGPPVIRIPRERYIVEAWRASPVVIYETFMAPPVERIEQRYTLDQVRYSGPLRERMPRVDLDINFETGSWELTPDQIERLAAVADGLKRAIAKNPREVFLIEGHTDAVGEPEDNLSLSDRRAETVAVALTEQFRVPPENLVTQGYGEENLKVPTQGPEPANRYVTVRRITPLIDQAENTGRR